MLKADIKREIKQYVLKSGKLPEGLIDEIKPRLPYNALKTISRRTNIPYATVQGIFAQNRKSASPHLVKAVSSSVDLLVELWGEDVLPFIWGADND